MSKNPFYNAIAAGGYIALVSLFIFWVNHSHFTGPDNILIPMGMLALLVLSAALMGYLFFYQPVILLIEGKKSEAARLLLSTIGAFAVIAVLYMAFALYLSR